MDQLLREVQYGPSTAVRILPRVFRHQGPEKKACMPIQTNTTASDGTDLADAELTVSRPTRSLDLQEIPVNAEDASTRGTCTVSVVRQKSSEETTALELSFVEGATGLSGLALPKWAPTGSDPGSKPKHSIPVSRGVVRGHVPSQPGPDSNPGTPAQSPGLASSIGYSRRVQLSMFQSSESQAFIQTPSMSLAWADTIPRWISGMIE